MSASAAWLAGAAVAVLAIATVVLVVFAIQRTGPVASDQAADPIPSFAFGADASPTPSPSPVATAAPGSAVNAGATERFLSIGSNVMWRGTAGDCAAAIAPTIERSADGGATWRDVTPAYRGIAQLASLDAFAQTEAETVAAVGAGCETQALRTFTQGKFWDSYPDVLAASRYLDPASASTVVTPQGRLEAPCADPVGFRAQGTTVALVCEGAAYQLVDGAWTRLETAGVLTLGVAGGDILLASTAPECAGVAVTRITDGVGVPAGCAADADPAAPLAIAGTDSTVRLWSGDAVLSLTP